VYEDIVSGISGAKKGGFKTCAVYDDTNKDETETLKELADNYIAGWNELLK
jgi:beta-phosphoglucomutase-like phosphatase (HAD superfamily)